MTWMVKDKTLSDYLIACKDASNDLRNFKRDHRYTKILEHASYEIGKEYLEMIKRDNPKLLQNPGLFDGEEIGNPVRHWYEGLLLSPSTLQYIGVLSNLINLFGSLEGKRVIEIGGGYGGQCQVIQAQFEVLTYEILDLKEACALQYKYLSNFNATVITWDQQIPKGDWDLCISNYALSEIKDPLQSKYVDRVLKNSAHGYVTCNREIPALTWGKRSPDIRAERDTNFIITW